mgnify:CR=1 FL=1
MPTSAATRALNNTPTRFDLYALEDKIDWLAGAICNQVNSTDNVNSAVERLTDVMDEVRMAVDALTKAVEKLPEQMPIGGNNE